MKSNPDTGSTLLITDRPYAKEHDINFFEYLSDMLNRVAEMQIGNTSYASTCCPGIRLLSKGKEKKGRESPNGSRHPSRPSAVPADRKTKRP